MSDTQSLLERARESARRARARAQALANAQFGGGNDEEDFDLDEIEQDEKFFDQEGGYDDEDEFFDQEGGYDDEDEFFDQEGGRKNLISDKRFKPFYAKIVAEAARLHKKVPSEKTVRNFMRTHTATINGKKIMIKETNKPCYYHGRPLAAARKALAKYFRTAEGQSKLSGHNPVQINMEEVSKGVHMSRRDGDKSPKRNYVRRYWGWVEGIPEPVTFVKENKKKGTTAKITPVNKFVVIPWYMKDKDFDAAIARHRSRSAAAKAKTAAFVKRMAEVRETEGRSANTGNLRIRENIGVVQDRAKAKRAAKAAKKKAAKK